MSNQINKQQINALLGKQIGNKLSNLLNPCCKITFRTEAVCNAGQICITLYATSPITQTIYLSGGVQVGDGGVSINNYVSFIAGQEIQLDTMCFEAGNPAEGVYTGVISVITSGEPVIGTVVSIDVPFCDG